MTHQINGNALFLIFRKSFTQFQERIQICTITVNFLFIIYLAMLYPNKVIALFGMRPKRVLNEIASCNFKLVSLHCTEDDIEI